MYYLVIWADELHGDELISISHWESVVMLLAMLLTVILSLFIFGVFQWLCNRFF
jgi:hypothetical protein